MDPIPAKSSLTHKVRRLSSKTRGIDPTQIDHMTTSSETLDPKASSQTLDRLTEIDRRVKSCHLLPLRLSRIFLGLLYPSPLDSLQAALFIRQATTHSRQIRMVVFPAQRDRRHRPCPAYLVITKGKDSRLRRVADFPVPVIFEMNCHPPLPPETKAPTDLPPFADRPVSTGSPWHGRYAI
jgi:hypothetical protein